MDKKVLSEHLTTAIHHLRQAAKMVDLASQTEFELGKREEQLQVDLKRVAVMQKNINRTQDSQRGEINRLEQLAGDIEVKRASLKKEKEDLEIIDSDVTKKLEEYSNILRKENEEEQKKTKIKK